jgi:prevent-host-death family protein
VRLDSATEFCTELGTPEVRMAKTLPTRDIRSLSEVRANVAEVVRQVQRTRRPVFLTEHGRGAAVLIDVTVYERASRDALRS